MRAVILCVAGMLVAGSAQAGSLEVKDAAFVPKDDSRELGLPTFSEGMQAGALSFNAIGQRSSTVQMFDLGGKSAKPADGDVLRELQLNLSGAEQAAKEPTTLSD